MVYKVYEGIKMTQIKTPKEYKIKKLLQSKEFPKEDMDILRRYD